MLYKSNILALVGGGNNPKFSTDKVIIWDELQEKIISQLRFDTDVKNVKLTKEKIVIVCEKKIYIFNLKNLSIINESIETFPNPKGLIAISYKIFKLAFPSKELEGSVEIYSNENNENQTIKCHGKKIQMLSLNLSGTLLATASEKGTLIRIYTVFNGNLVQELRRGTDNAKIYSINFDPLNKFIVCNSEKTTVHIFSLYNANLSLKSINKEQNDNKEDDVKVPKNSTNNWGKLLGIFNKKNYEYSFAKVKIEDNKFICQWGNNDKILALSLNGNYYQVQFNPEEGGDYKIETVIKLKEK